MKREYLTFSLEEFFLLGRKDALNDTIKLTNDIMNSINDRVRLFNSLKMYLLGYRIGVLESYFKNIEISTSFNIDTKSFIYYSEEGKQKKVSFDIGYDSLLKEASEESKLLMSRSVIC